MHKILFATIAGLLVTFQPAHAANPATGADSIAAIVEDFDAFNRAQDPIRAAQRGDKQAARIYQLILGKMPDQLKLPFYLWTRAAVAQLIAREYGKRV